MRMITLASLITVVIFAAAIWLQVFLSRKESKWFGLILPFIYFANSLLNVFSFVGYEWTVREDIFAQIVHVFFMANIPTIILLFIYFGFRKKIKHKSDLEKMNIQDLE